MSSIHVCRHAAVELIPQKKTKKQKNKKTKKQKKQKTGMKIKTYIHVYLYFTNI
jgi:hypothetical protein